MKKAAIIGTSALLVVAFCAWFYVLIATISDLKFDDNEAFL